MSDEKGVRNGLLDLEPLNPEMKHKFERQIRDLADGKLTRGMRVYWWLFLVACVIQAWFFGYNLVVSPVKVETTLGFALLLCFVASVAFGAFVAIILFRGRVSIHRQVACGKLLPAIGLTIVFLSFLYGMDDPSKPGAVWFGIYALAVLVVTCSINLWNRIVAADLRNQEHLLRLEYRLADLAPAAGRNDKVSE